MYTKPMALDRTFGMDFDNFPANVQKTTELFGFEIELEGKKIRTARPDICVHYATHVDNSLRVHLVGSDALEYVFHKPLDLGGTLVAVKTLMKFLNEPEVEVFSSYRTSIHVHVNCAADKVRHVYNFMTLAIIFDELFVSQNGDHRIGNNFCLRAKDAQGQISHLVNSIEHHGNIFSLNAQHRYSSVNFVSLLKYGTLEFRSLECTTDYDRVEHWIKTLNTLKIAARQFDDPKDIIRYYSKMSTKEFLFFVLGAQAAKYAAVPNFEAMLHDGMRLAQDFAYSSEWKTRAVGDIPEPKPKKKQAKLYNPMIPPPNWAINPIEAVQPHQGEVVLQQWAAFHNIQEPGQ